MSREVELGSHIRTGCLAAEFVPQQLLFRHCLWREVELGSHIRTGCLAAVFVPQH